MYGPPFWFILTYYVPLFLLLIVFVYFYFRAIKHPGLEKLRKFTNAVLQVIVFIVVVAYFRFDIWHLMDYVPFEIWNIIKNDYLRLTLILGLIIYCLISILLIKREKSARFLQMIWLLIIVCNIASIAQNTWSYFTWKPPVPRPNAPLVEQILLNHIIGPAVYARMMIIPFGWVIVSCISLLKIRKEGQRRLAQQTPS